MSKQEVPLEDFSDLITWFGCVENIEGLFGIEFSCGDGLFLTDLESDWDTFCKYDGLVDATTFRQAGKVKKGSYVFKFTYNEDWRETGSEEFTNCRVVKAK